MQTEQNERHHESDSMSISSERHCESSFKQFQLMSTQNSSSSLTSVGDKLAWQIGDLISTLVNKLVTVTFETDRQYSCCIRETNFKTKYLIQVLSLQTTTQSKIRLTADDLVSYKETFNNLSQKTVSSDIFISEKNSSILSLIKNAQEFDLQCR